MIFDGDAAAMEFLRSARCAFVRMKQLAEKSFEQLDEVDLSWSPDYEQNSIAVIVQHMRGNMISRWTHFLTSDGEKPDRDRDAEFISHASIRRETMMDSWEEGWASVFHALNSLTPDDLMRPVTIRGEIHTVYEAIHRQMFHYSYHIGQIVMIAKMRKRDEWKSLSIPCGQSKAAEISNR